MLDSDSRMMSSADPACRKTYLSKIVMLSECYAEGVGGLPAPEQAAALHAYGLEIGYAFQIADDVLDYAGDLHDTGKTRGQDLRDGKLTLPLILACERDPGLARAVAQLLAHGKNHVLASVAQFERYGCLECPRR